MKRGPFAALLILLSLVLGSAGAAAAGGAANGPAARPGSSRHNVAAALLPAGTRNTLDDEVSSNGPGAVPPESAPGIVTEILWSRPVAEARFAESTTVPRPAANAYRARAPPAS